MESAVDEARRPASLALNRLRQPQSGSLVMQRLAGTSGSGLRMNPFLGINRQNGGCIQRIPGGGITTSPYRFRTSSNQLSTLLNPFFAGGLAVGAGADYYQEESSDVLGLFPNQGQVRIHSRFVNQNNSPQAPIIVINSIYNSDPEAENPASWMSGTGRGNGAARFQTAEYPLQAEDVNHNLCVTSNRNANQQRQVHRAQGPKWQGKRNGVRNGNVQRQRKFHGLPVTGSWRDANISKQDLDNDLEAYMAKASGGLAKVKLSSCENEKAKVDEIDNGLEDLNFTDVDVMDE